MTGIESRPVTGQLAYVITPITGSQAGKCEEAHHGQRQQTRSVISGSLYKPLGFFVWFGFLPSANGLSMRSA